MEMLGLQPSKDWLFSGSVEKKALNQLQLLLQQTTNRMVVTRVNIIDW
jgi:hypothetical protein